MSLRLFHLDERTNIIHQKKKWLIQAKKVSVARFGAGMQETLAEEEIDDKFWL